MPLWVKCALAALGILGFGVLAIMAVSIHWTP